MRSPHVGVALNAAYRSLRQKSDLATRADKRIFNPQLSRNSRTVLPRSVSSATYLSALSIQIIIPRIFAFERFSVMGEVAESEVQFRAIPKPSPAMNARFWHRAFFYHLIEFCATHADISGRDFTAEAPWRKAWRKHR